MYLDELKRLLAIAEHPDVKALLQGAVSAAEKDSSQPKQNGDSKVEPAGRTDAKIEMKPVMKSREATISSARITNYGEIGICRGGWGEVVVGWINKNLKKINLKKTYECRYNW